jgi:hypothetical protein
MTIGQGEFRSKLAYDSLTGYQYRFVQLRTDDTISLCDATNLKPYGVLLNAPDTGEVGAVCVSGECMVDATGLSGGTFANGNIIGANATGKAILTSTNGMYPRGRVVRTGSDSTLTSLITVQLFDSGIATI